MVSKPKLAPRSSLQFKVGPQFIPTVSNLSIISSRGKNLTPVVTPRIDRGFERLNGEWIGYKRNYFTLVCSFHFENHDFSQFVDDAYFAVNLITGERTEIKYFALRLISKCAEDGSDVALVQHTAKRDLGPQVSPPIFPAVPSVLPDHEVIRNAANVRNANKIAKLDQIFFCDKDMVSFRQFGGQGLRYYPDDKIAKVARYERIQFSSSINHKKPSSNSKRFKLYAELVGNTGGPEFISLAYTETPPLIIRGRSPSNYNHQETSKASRKVDTSSNMSEKASSKDSKSLTMKSRKDKAPKVSKLKLKLSNVVATTSQEAEDSSNVGPSFLDKSLDDQITYEILLKANKQMDEMSSPMPNSPSHMLATSTPTGKLMKPRKPKGLLRDALLKKLKKPRRRGEKSGVTESPSVKNNAKTERKYTGPKLTKKNATDLKKLIIDQKVHFPLPSDFELDNFDFDSSIGDIELIDYKARKSLSLTHSFRNENLKETDLADSHDMELLLMRSRVEDIRLNESELADYFSRIHQSHPSEMLSTDFDDGPSFMIC
jgi:meiosis-specific transcription factor NDT80